MQNISKFLLRKFRLNARADKVRPVLLHPVFWVAVGAVFAGLAGPYGTFLYWPLGLRVMFWLGVAVGGYVISEAFRRVLQVRYEDRDNLFADTLAAVFTVPAAAAWALALDHLMPKKLEPGMFTYAEMLGYAAELALIVLAGRALFLWASQHKAELNKAERGARLRARLPEELDGQILKLTANGHFVEITTGLGTHAVRMRFTDAISEMEPIEGYCAHRSHWVARAAITKVDNEDGKTWLTISNGERVPVSRKYRPRLEEAGIIT